MNSVHTIHGRQAYAQKPIHDWRIDMQFIRRMRDTLVRKALPTAAECSQESSRLAEKLATQIQWMEKRGIDIRLKESERPPSPAQKPALPGTVIYFSSTS